jgi:hypothetical protein
MGHAQNSGKTAPGRPFPPGMSGNPGGRPKGLAAMTRELVGGDGRAIAAFWVETMQDPENPLRLRLEASKLLAERGWGRSGSGDLPIPVGLAPPLLDEKRIDRATEELFAELDRLAAAG